MVARVWYAAATANIMARQVYCRIGFFCAVMAPIYLSRW